MEEKLLVGFCEKSITPEDRPVSLAGQFHIRISEYVETPCLTDLPAFTIKSSSADESSRQIFQY